MLTSPDYLNNNDVDPTDIFSKELSKDKFYRSLGYKMGFVDQVYNTMSARDKQQEYDGGLKKIEEISNRAYEEGLAEIVARNIKLALKDVPKEQAARPEALSKAILMRAYATNAEAMGKIDDIGAERKMESSKLSELEGWAGMEMVRVAAQLKELGSLNPRPEIMEATKARGGQINMDDWKIDKWSKMWQQVQDEIKAAETKSASGEESTERTGPDAPKSSLDEAIEFVTKVGKMIPAPVVAFASAYIGAAVDDAMEDWKHKREHNRAHVRQGEPAQARSEPQAAQVPRQAEAPQPQVVEMKIGDDISKALLQSAEANKQLLEELREARKKQNGEKIGEDTVARTKAEELERRIDQVEARLSDPREMIYRKRVETLANEMEGGKCRECGGEVGEATICPYCLSQTPRVDYENAKADYDSFLDGKSTGVRRRAVGEQKKSEEDMGMEATQGMVDQTESARQETPEINGNGKSYNNLHEFEKHRPDLEKEIKHQKGWMREEDLKGFGIPLVAPVQEYGGQFAVVTDVLDTVALWNKSKASYDQLSPREKHALDQALSEVSGMVALDQLIDKHWNLAATSNLDTIKALFGGAKDFYFQEAFKLVAKHDVGKKIFGPMMAIAFCRDETLLSDRKRMVEESEVVWASMSEKQQELWKTKKAEELKELYKNITKGESKGATKFGLKVRELFPQVFYETSDTNDTLIVTAGATLNEVLAKAFDTSQGMVDITSALVRSVNFQWQCFKGAQMYANFPEGEEKLWRKGIAGNLPAGATFQEEEEMRSEILKNWKSKESDEEAKDLSFIEKLLEKAKGKKARSVQLWEYVDVFMKEMDVNGVDEEGRVNDIFLDGVKRVDKTAMSRGWSQYSELIGVFNDIRLAVQGKKTEATGILDLTERVNWVRKNVIKKINSWAGFNAELCYGVADRALNSIAEAWRKNPASGGKGLPPDVATLEKVHGKQGADVLARIRNLPQQMKEDADERFAKKYVKKLF